MICPECGTFTEEPHLWCKWDMSLCARCRKPNDFEDDLGFFYWHTNRKHPLVELGEDTDYNKEANYVPVCRKCFDDLGLTTAER